MYLQIIKRLFDYLFVFLHSGKVMKALNDDPDSKVRDRLLQVVSKLVARHGFDGTSTREIARLAECNVSLISYYFGGKEGLYRAALLHFAEAMQKKSPQFEAALRPSKMTASSFETFLGELIRHSIAMHSNFPDMQIVLFREFSSGLPYAQQIFTDYFQKSIVELEAIILRAQEAGIVVKELLPRAFLVNVLQLVDAFVMTQHCGAKLTEFVYPAGATAESFQKHLLNLLLRGALKRS